MEAIVQCYNKHGLPLFKNQESRIKNHFKPWSSNVLEEYNRLYLLDTGIKALLFYPFHTSVWKLYAEKHLDARRMFLPSRDQLIRTKLDCKINIALIYAVHFQG